MPVHALIPHPHARRRRGSLLLVPVVAAAALVAGLLPGVARADGPITITGSITFTGDLFLPDVPELDITSQFPEIQFGYAPPPVGEAHLFDKDSGRVPMTDAQYAGMVAMEDDAVAAVRAYHRMSDTPNNHDLVVVDDRPELLAALFARLRQATFDDSPTQAESAAVGWLVSVAQAHALATATAAKAEFDRFNADDGTQVCRYRPPAPFTDWPTEEAVRSCRKLLPGEVPGPPQVPETGQFAAWGDVVANPYTPAQTSLVGNTSAAAVAWGASTGAASGAAAALGIAQALTEGGLTKALRPFATRVAVSLIRPALVTAAQTTYAAEGTVDAAIAAERAAVTTAQLGQSAARFTPLLAVADVAGIALIVAAAIVEAVMAGIDYTQADTVGRDLDRAIDNARNTRPDMRELLDSDSGRQQVLLDLTSTVLDCNDDTGNRDSRQASCNAHPELPTRLATDPIFQLATSDDSQSPPLTTSIPVTIGRPGSQFDTRLTIRDGWLLLDGIPTPLTQFPYVDHLGQPRIAKLIGGSGGYLFQSERDLSSDTASDTATAYDPDVRCVDGYDRDAACFLSGLLPMRDSAGHAIYLNQLAHRPPPPATLTVSPLAVVGQLVPLTTAGGPLTSYDGVPVTERWVVESDSRCLYTRPDDFRSSCPGTVQDGVHGGWTGTLPAGVSTTTWNAPGTWRVTQVRTDDYGVTQWTSTDITVLPAAASFAAACTAPCAAAPGGAPVTVTGSVNSGRTQDAEAVTIDWGDGTSTTGVPSGVSGTSGTIAPGMTATRTSFVSQTFSATHSYTTNINGAPIRVSEVDTGDRDPAPITFVPATPPVVDPGSYGNVSADTAVGFAKVEFATPTFRDAAGTSLPVRCTSQSGGVFRVGTTPVTCSATNGAGLTSSASFSVTVHSYEFTLVPGATTVRAGQAVTFVPHGYTDDGRDIGPITDQGVTAEALSPDTLCELLTCRRTSSWGSILVHPIIGDLIVGGDAEVYTVPDLPARTVVTGGDAQSVPAGTTLPQPLTVLVTDAYGNPVPGAPVTVTVTSGDAGVGPALGKSVVVTSGPDGQVSRSLALGSTPGPVTVTATSPGATSSTWHVTSITGPLQGVSGNGQQAVLGRPVVPLAVRVSDPSGAPVAGVPVTFTVSTGGATLGGASTVTVPSGPDGTAAVTPSLGTAEGPVAVDVQAGSYGRVGMTFTVVKNTAPTALPRSWSTTSGAGPLNVAAPGVLTGARDAQGDAITAVLVRKPGHGTLTLRPDGSFTYAPNTSFVGTDTFTWRATDGTLPSAVKTVTLNVLAAKADLATTLVAPATARRGTQVPVTVTLSDLGPSTGRVVAGAVQVPAGLRIVKAPTPFTISGDGRTAQVSLATLPYGTTRTYALVVAVAATARTGDQTLSSVVSSLSVPDPAKANNQARAVLRVG